MADVLTLGEALIDFVSLESGVSLMESSGFYKAAGGAPANVAAGLARLGISSAFLGKVGQDAFGHFLEHTLSLSGVDTRGIVFDANAKTGLAFVSLTKEGERDFLFYRNPSADMLYRTDELPSLLFNQSLILHYGAISLISEPSRSATFAAIQMARERGMLISCDPNLRLSLWDSEESAKEGTWSAVRESQILKISEEEARFLFGECCPEEAADRLLEQGPLAVFITLGDSGCYFATKQYCGHIPTYKVDVVDTTGAGDGFMAGLLIKMVEEIHMGRQIADFTEYDYLQFIKYANAVGAITCTRKGAIPALPSKDQVDAFLDSKR